MTNYQLTNAGATVVPTPGKPTMTYTVYFDINLGLGKKLVPGNATKLPDQPVVWTWNVENDNSPLHTMRYSQPVSIGTQSIVNNKIAIQIVDGSSTTDRAFYPFSDYVATRRQHRVNHFVYELSFQIHIPVADNRTITAEPESWEVLADGTFRVRYRLIRGSHDTSAVYQKTFPAQKITGSNRQLLLEIMTDDNNEIEELVSMETTDIPLEDDLVK
jgi:hypothetical protein